MEPAGPRSRLLAKRPRWFPSLLGALVLGVLVPCVLVWVRTAGTLESISHIDDFEHAEAWNPVNLATLMVFAGIFCGPGALLLALLLFFMLRSTARRPGAGERYVLTLGAFAGAFIAFVNFPGYMSGVFFMRDPFGIVRIVALFAVTGATCGFWIGWQAYLEEHPERGFFPRFSLRTLIAFAFGWGVLLMLFMPR